MDEPSLVIEPLGAHHDRAAFSCGEPALDTYLRRQASQDARRRVAQVFVAFGEPPATIAVYAVIVDAKNEHAQAFYERYGYRAFTAAPRRAACSSPSKHSGGSDCSSEEIASGNGALNHRRR